MDLHRTRLRLRQALRREHVLDLGCADAERQCTERTVCARVAVATDDRHSRSSEPKLGADDVDDALFGRVDVEEPDPELRGVLAQGLDLATRKGIGEREGAVLRRDVVIDRCDGAIRPTDNSALATKAFESLRRRDLVHEVQIDVEQWRPSVRLIRADNDVTFP